MVQRLNIFSRVNEFSAWGKQRTLYYIYWRVALYTVCVRMNVDGLAGAYLPYVRAVTIARSERPVLRRAIPE